MPSAQRQFGRYEAVEVIGQGGMGVVYRGHDPLIERDVAIKTLPLPVPEDGDEARAKQILARIVREIQTAGALSHPNIAAVHDIGETDECIFIVMELVEGDSLERLLEDNALPGERVADIVRQAAAALDYAHNREVIHRDVKPSNILIDRLGQVKLVDFGIAKTMTGARLTNTGIVVGTPEYLAPEQLKDLPAGPPADQYALAVTAYRMLSGRLPFEADSTPELLTKVLHEKPQLAAELSGQTAKALRRGLAKDPERRYASCAEFAAALQLDAAAPAPLAAPRRTAPFWALAGAGLVVAAALALYWTRAGTPPDPAPPAASVPAPGPVEAEPSPPPAPTPEPAAAVEQPTPPREQPQPQPAPPVQPPVAQLVPSGPVVELVWRGSLDPGAVLVIENGRPGSGELSAALPAQPISVEISPPGSLEIIEAPSASNGWARLLVRNQGRARSLFLIRYRRLTPRP